MWEAMYMLLIGGAIGEISISFLSNLNFIMNLKLFKKKKTLKKTAPHSLLYKIFLLELYTS